ncbi:hypothetical protein, partial [Vibrio hyugaensis]|uniref:hypothetical protein n=1 Tax=Vibrio hyugaensis TaxID=1534743 RepID=UPI0015E35EAD
YKDYVGKNLYSYPIIDKKFILENYYDLVCSVDNSDYVINFTGGTTGEVLPLIRTKDEVEFNNKFRESLNLPCSSVNTILVDTSNHGVCSTPFRRNEVVLPLIHEKHYELLLDYMAFGVPSPQGKVKNIKLVINIGSFKRLCSFVEEKNLLLNFSTEVICLYGDSISDYWRDKGRSLFQADIVTTYGMSEYSDSVGAECEHCGCYHMSYNVYEEFVKYPLEGADIENFGSILLTSLYPFYRTLPFIRYKTNDYFISYGLCESTGLQSYSFAGRAKDIFLVRYKSKVIGFITKKSIIELVDGEDWVHYTKDNFAYFLSSKKTGTPVVTLSDNEDGISISFKSEIDKIYPELK